MRYRDPDYHKNWRIANRDHVLESGRRYRAENLERERERARKYYQDNREDVKRRKKLQRDSAKLAVHAFLGGACSDCRTSDSRVLHIHHTQGGGSKDRFISKKEQNLEGYYTLLLERVQNEPGSLELLCANCHLIRHWNERNGGNDA